MIYSQHQRSKRFLYLSCVILFLGSAIALRLMFFWISVTHVPASPDESLAGLEAKRIHEGQFKLLLFGQPYQFPLESYLSAPFVNLMTRNALEARLDILIMGFLTVLFFLMIFGKIGSLKTTWPGLLLVLFPSAYFLTFQCAYSPPQYSVIALLSSLLIWIGISIQGRKNCFIKVGLIGFLGGLALSSHILVLSVIVPVTLWICLGENWKDLLHRTPFFILGLLMGLVPYILAYRFHPGAYHSVEKTRDFLRALDELLPAFTRTLPGAMGIAPPLFPDDSRPLKILPEGAPVIFSIIFISILMMITIRRIVTGIRSLVRCKWPIWEVTDVFLTASYLCLIVFCLNTRSNSGGFRYLLPIVWFFPFLLNDLYLNSKKFLRCLLSVFAIFLAGINLASSAILMNTWTKTDFAKKEARVPDIKPLIAYLKQNQIRFIYAPYGISYRIPYETDETIICSQPYNERFRGWPLPYKDIVDHAQNVVFAFSDFTCKGLSWSKFENFLKEMNITYKKYLRYDFKLYFNFQSDSRQIPQRQLTVTSNHNSASSLYMVDGDRNTLWKSRSSQEAGMWIELRLLKKNRINQIELFYDANNHDRAPALNIYLQGRQGWRKVLSEIKDKLNVMTFENGHPVFFKDIVQVYRFNPVVTDAVRIEIADPNSKRNWSISEIEIFRKVSDRQPKELPE